MRTIKTKYKKKRRNTTKIRRNIAKRAQNIEKKTKKKEDNHKEKDTKETKIILNAKRRERQTGERRAVANQPKVIHAYYIFYSFHLICSIYY